VTEVVVFVEVPMGSRNKYELDTELGSVVLDRRLFTSMAYPADYGFVEGTLGEDGDPLDALVLVGDPTFPGCRIRARVVGVFHMTDEKGPDEHFFTVYKDLEDAKVAVRGYGNRSEAEQVLADAVRRSSA
jgi:inorganic pyrophosphatase